MRVWEGTCCGFSTRTISCGPGRLAPSLGLREIHLLGPARTGARRGLAAQSKPRARDLGIALDGTPGPPNAITDVQGVEVGYEITNTLSVGVVRMPR